MSNCVSCLSLSSQHCSCTSTNAHYSDCINLPSNVAHRSSCTRQSPTQTTRRKTQQRSIYSGFLNPVLHHMRQCQVEVQGEIWAKKMCVLVKHILRSLIASLGFFDQLCDTRLEMCELQQILTPRCFGQLLSMRCQQFCLRSGQFLELSLTPPHMVHT